MIIISVNNITRHDLKKYVYVNKYVYVIVCVYIWLQVKM